jgi:DNA-binding response OmpR family regulator
LSDDIYKKLTILCVDDEDGVRRRVSNALSYYFKEVLEAGNGKIGYELYEEHLPDIILCDVEMPIMNGIEMIKKIRKKDIKTPIVVLTAYSNEKYLMKLINLHIQHYILKPITSQKLLDGIYSALLGRSTGVISLAKSIFLDIDNNSLHVNEEVINLSSRETKFLTLIANNKEQIIYYATIEEELWESKTMSQDALKSFMRDLRKKLPYDMVENISQVGYRLK